MNFSAALLLAALVVVTIVAAPARAGDHPAIMLVGYWPPSNEAVRPFSTDPVQNPDGWIGENWEGRGYDVHSFFPEFDPPDCFSCGPGMGDFEVDYQDTSEDWWAIVEEIQPVAIITFSRGSINLSWEAEMNAYNHDVWIDDYIFPFQPTPSPPDDSVPAGTLRPSQLPVQQIVADVDAADLGLDPYVCYSGNAGGFLSEFLAYHGVWYQALHNHPDDAQYCVAAGHIHVGGNIDWPTARAAADVTIRAVIEHIDPLLALPGDFDGSGVVDTADLLTLLANWGECDSADDCAGDIVIDSKIDIQDLLALLSNWG